MVEVRHWSDLEDAFLRMTEREWEDLRSVPGFSGDEEFDRAMLEFQAEMASKQSDEEDDEAETLPGLGALDEGP